MQFCEHLGPKRGHFLFVITMIVVRDFDHYNKVCILNYNIPLATLCEVNSTMCKMSFEIRVFLAKDINEELTFSISRRLFVDFLSRRRRRRCCCFILLTRYDLKGQKKSERRYQKVSEAGHRHLLTKKN